MKNKLIILMLPLLLGTLFAEATIFESTEFQVEAVKTKVNKELNLIGGVVKSEFEQNVIAFTPSLFFNEKWSLNGHFDYRENNSEDNYDYSSGNWSENAYKGHAWLMSGQIRHTFNIHPKIKLLPGLGYYYDFKREGFINNNSKLWQGTSYGPYMAISAFFQLSPKFSLSLQERYVLARLRSYSIENNKKSANPRYNDRIYSNVVEIAYLVKPAFKVGLGYEYENGRAKEPNTTSPTVTKVNAGKIFFNHGF